MWVTESDPHAKWRSNKARFQGNFSNTVWLADNILFAGASARSTQLILRFLPFAILQKRKWRKFYVKATICWPSSSAWRAANVIDTGILWEKKKKKKKFKMKMKRKKNGKNEWTKMAYRRHFRLILSSRTFRTKVKWRKPRQYFSVLFRHFHNFFTRSSQLRTNIAAELNQHDWNYSDLFEKI